MISAFQSAGQQSMSQIFCYIVLLTLSLSAGASDDIFPEGLEARVARVSDGELRFLESPPQAPVHYHYNEIEITESSLIHGWVRLRQCHYNLDPVPELEIVYSPERIRDLKILSADKVGESRVSGPKIQISEIARGGQICISAESRALRRQGGNRYMLQNGPYMRRFLDGYYPMQISMHLSLPETIRLMEAEPKSQPGMEVDIREQSASLKGWFEGILYTRFWMCSLTGPDCP